MSAKHTDPQAWHSKPKGYDKLPCPVCRCPYSRIGEHRATGPDNPAGWQRRKPDGAIVDLDPGAGTETLSAYVERYLLTHDLSETTVEQMRRTVRQFDEFAGSPSLGRIVDDDVNRWIVHMLNSGLAKPTAKGKRGHLITLLNFAAAEGLAQQPRMVRKVRPPHAIVRAWTPQQLQKLLTVCPDVKGWFPQTGVKRSDYWRAFVRVAYETGFRLSDLLYLQFDDINPDGQVLIVQHKSNRPHKRTLKPETLEAIKAIERPHRRLIFEWGARREYFYRDFRRLLKAAGLFGSSKFLRRSGATHIVAEGGTLEDAAKHLGHSPKSGVELAIRSYVDLRQTPDESKGTPELAEDPLADALADDFSDLPSLPEEKPEENPDRKTPPDADAMEWM